MKNLLALLAFLLVTPVLPAQKSNLGNNIVSIPAGISEDSIISIAANIAPSARQLRWQQMEGTAFIHFGMNTFYNQEWGKGNEDPKKFNPTDFDPEQWIRVLKGAGEKLVILTCKHHDGFCLWPSRYTTHSVAYSSWKNGKGDVVKEVRDACKKYGVKFGVYLSPWDRHEPVYGDSPKYNQYFRNQLTELLSNYGKIDEVWFDGACGEGPNGKKQVYDWPSYYNLIRKLQPRAVIAIMGPDIRWVGTESGYGRESEWSVVPISTASQESIAANSQQEAVTDGFMPPGDLVNSDLGSREKISKASKLVWYPSEVDVSIRPGWFWHKAEDSLVKEPEKLLDIYFSSVGRNSLLLLNVPPDTRGRITNYDISALNELHRAVTSIFETNLLKQATPKVLTGGNSSKIYLAVDAKDSTQWMPANQGNSAIEFTFKENKTFDVMMLQENIRIGQRIEKFHLDAWDGAQWNRVTEGTTVGYKRLLRFPPVTTKKVRLVIDQSRLRPALAEIGIYRNIPHVKAIPGQGTFNDSIQVSLQSSGQKVATYYTTNGSIPGTQSLRYSNPLVITKNTILRYVSFSIDGKRSFYGKSMYTKTK